MPLNCPVHAIPLTSRGRYLHCEACQSDYRLAGTCLQCGAELEHLQACGSSSWFCNSCNQLKSKSAVSTRLVLQDKPPV
jgi:hypothetical protein